MTSNKERKDMPRMMLSYHTVDEYIASFPTKTQALLKKMRATLRAALPKEAAEKISYGIPTFVFHGNLVHFAAYTTHLGLYPGSRAIVTFEKELKPYETSKGTIRLPLDQPLPVALVKKITAYCVMERLKKKASKR